MHNICSSTIELRQSLIIFFQYCCQFVFRNTTNIGKHGIHRNIGKIVDGREDA